MPTKTVCNLKTKYPSAEGGTFQYCCTEDNCKDCCIYIETSTEVLRRKYRIFADYFVFSCGKTPASPDPSGSLKLFMTYDKSVSDSFYVLMAGFLQSQSFCKLTPDYPARPITLNKLKFYNFL